MLVILDQETETNLEVELSMVYDRDAERPRTLQVRIRPKVHIPAVQVECREGRGGRTLSPSDRAGVERECRAFYRHRLVTALGMAFSA